MTASIIARGATTIKMRFKPGLVGPVSLVSQLATIVASLPTDRSSVAIGQLYRNGEFVAIRLD